MSAYRLDDLTKVYPIARGTAPIFIVIFSLLLFNLNISKFELAGILVISFGIIALSFQNVKNFKTKGRGMHPRGANPEKGGENRGWLFEEPIL